MDKLPVTALATRNAGEPGALQIGSQLANLARHTPTLPDARHLCQRKLPANRLPKYVSQCLNPDGPGPTPIMPERRLPSGGFFQTQALDKSSTRLRPVL